MRLFVDNLINLDFSYLHPQRGLVGETWLAHVELTGELDGQGMICDFGVVKKTLREWLERELDHRLLVPVKHAALTLEETDNHYDLRWQFGGDHLECLSPKEAMAIVDTDEITPTKVTRWVVKRLTDVLPGGIGDLAVYFSHERIHGPYYHYSHGLKKHEGNCQRIAHGHRSRIQIWRNGAPCEECMTKWANRWQDIYIGTRDDLTHPADERSHYRFAYKAPQGRFALSLPRARCYLIDTDSTVEHIARHIATELYREYPRDECVVKAYEGIGKGAIAEN